MTCSPSAPVTPSGHGGSPASAPPSMRQAWSSPPRRPTCSRIRYSGTAGSPPTTGMCAGSRSPRCCAISTWPRSSAPGCTCAGAAGTGRNPARQRMCAPRSTATRRPSTCSASMSWTRDTACGSRSSRSRTSPVATSCCPPSGMRWRSSASWMPRGDILLPTVGHALACIGELEHPELVGVNPEVGHEEMSGLNYAHGIAQALWHRKLFHIDLNGQHGPRYDQDLRFGAGNARGAFWVVDALESGRYDGPVHFDFKPPRTEDDQGVWASAAACMRNYLILRDKVRAFRADPEVAGALRAARVDQLALPTLADGETWRDVRGFAPDTEALGARGMAFERLDQLALEHLYGTR